MTETIIPRREFQPPPEPDPMEVLFDLFDGLLNALFSMTLKAALIRLVLLIFGMGAVLGLVMYAANPLSPGISRPVIMRLLAIIAPFIITFGVAAIFLDDIFELKDVRTAGNFIKQSAFGISSMKTIHIEDGDIRSSDKKSPIIRIGGPGRVQVGVESLAIFEKIDGTPRIVTATSGNLFFSEYLDGFERLRAVIDLRDQTIQISDLEARTKDGVRISIQNIRLLFSVLRDSQSATIQRPYTFSEKSILDLIYDQGKNNWFVAMTSLVRSELIAFISENTLTQIFAAVGEPEVDRQNSVQRLVQNNIYTVRQRSRRYRALDRQRSRAVVRPSISRRVRRYPRQMHDNRMLLRRLRRYRSPFRPRPADLLTRAPRATSPGGLHMNIPRSPAGRRNQVAVGYRQFGPRGGRWRKSMRLPVIYNQSNLFIVPAPSSVPRLEVSRRFSEEFARAFPARARQRGVRLQWIDVGTWHLPRSMPILDRQMDAWKITIENMVRSDPVVLSELRFMGAANEILRLMRLPIFRFIEISKQNLPRDEMVYQMVEEYNGMLRAMQDQMNREGQPLPERLRPALEHIRRYQFERLRRTRGDLKIGAPSSD